MGEVGLGGPGEREVPYRHKWEDRGGGGELVLSVLVGKDSVVEKERRELECRRLGEQENRGMEGQEKQRLVELQEQKSRDEEEEQKEKPEFGISHLILNTKETFIA